MYHSILLCTDLGDYSAAIANKAWQLANQYDAKLSIVHVIESIPTYGYSGSVDLQALSEKHAEKLLQALAKELQVPPEQAFIAIGSPKQEILEIADEISADLIILGSHGRHGLGQLLGSTANAIAHHALCDVLHVRIPD